MQRLAVLTTALGQAPPDPELIYEAMKDRVHQPYRKLLVGFRRVVDHERQIKLSTDSWFARSDIVTYPTISSWSTWHLSLRSRANDLGSCNSQFRSHCRRGSCNICEREHTSRLEVARSCWRVPVLPSRGELDRAR